MLTMFVSTITMAQLELSVTGPANASCNQTISIDVVVGGGPNANTFADLYAISYSLNWVPAELEYVSYTVNHISVAPETVINDLNVGTGEFTYSWSGANLANVTDGFVLLTLQMKVLTGTPNLDITGNPTGLSAIDMNFNDIGITPVGNFMLASVDPGLTINPLSDIVVSGNDFVPAVALSSIPTVRLLYITGQFLLHKASAWPTATQPVQIRRFQDL
jgi:hypothetical protein